MSTVKIPVPEEGLTLTENASFRLSDLPLDCLDTSYWVYGLAIEYARTNNITGLTALIEQGLDIGFNDGYLLYVATAYNCVPMIRFLTDRGLDVNAVTHRHDNLLECAAWHGHYDACEVLLALGAQVNVEPHSPIDSAASRGYTRICQLLIDFGEIVSLANIHDNACVSATRHNYPETLDLLLSHAKCRENMYAVLSKIVTLPEACAWIFIKHGACGYFPDNRVEEVFTAPARAVSKLTPDMDKRFIRQLIELQVRKSTRTPLSLMEKAPDWLQSYYLATLPSQL